MTEEKFTVKIHETYPLKDVARAHNVSIEFGDVIWKCVTNEVYRTLKAVRQWASC